MPQRPAPATGRRAAAAGWRRAVPVGTGHRLRVPQGDQCERAVLPGCGALGEPLEDRDVALVRQAVAGVVDGDPLERRDLVVRGEGAGAGVLLGRDLGRPVVHDLVAAVRQDVLGGAERSAEVHAVPGLLVDLADGGRRHGLTGSTLPFGRETSLWWSRWMSSTRGVPSCSRQTTAPAATTGPVGPPLTEWSASGPRSSAWSHSARPRAGGPHRRWSAVSTRRRTPGATNSRCRPSRGRTSPAPPRCGRGR